MDILSATDVRKNWSVTLDSVVRERPAYIKRTRDNIAIIGVETLLDALAGYKFEADVFNEEDGSVTMSARVLDIVVNEADKKSAKSSLAKEILEYAEDYYEHFHIWSSAPNRKGHIPYVLKALSLDAKQIEEELVCRSGKI
ncbi:MAG: hypothetical protein K6G83_14820 [Lachnospiraceae bacterium]|nr:hypothetical protein [Lachnospiraceae bacterium]